ncbi:hypothetical protein B9Z45_02510 [Limnohabitans sp. 2KL-17]|uniref:hypothetical protein n=1 Tax=Limnohabitans sp. 2KL-17 TaxID=1100704 RepID=UPI000D36B33E|nr:hypothetical protein [Limnohabitans sp. 2KL-17]PUE62946.1 hypothetical protein B9Z45_02510 [Limnohabitans sp. 2KL-17]
MATNPTTSTSFQPAFKRVAQQDRHDDTFAAIAILSGKTLDSVMRRAETMGLPRVGPYHGAITGDLIAKLLAAEGLVATVWKECSSFEDLPSVALVMVDYDESLELGRCLVYHVMELEGGKIAQHYIVDPYPHADRSLHIRVGTAALAGLTPSWYIGVTQMQKPATK